MEVYLNRIDGLDDAIISMFLSKRTLTRELELQVRHAVHTASMNMVRKDMPRGALFGQHVSPELKDWLDKLFKTKNEKACEALYGMVHQK